VIKVSLLKTFVQSEPPAARASRTLRVRVSVAGAAESMTGLKQAVEAIEAVDDYLMSANLRLETENGSGVPNSRIVQLISQEDSFMDSPDSTAVQDVQDDRIVLITIPTGGDEWVFT
jgi:predicted enzyme involved in methoxymalonyl-ACP biosynthesis